MDNQVMISLIGEQPIPNLLPIRHDRPQEVVLAYTTLTAKVYERLKKLLEKTVHVHPLSVPPYDIAAFQQQLSDLIKQKNWLATELSFNLTGGTKSMGFAAYELARHLNAPFLYFQSEGGQSKLFRYDFRGGRAALVQKEIIPSVLSVDDYLRAFLNDYEPQGVSTTPGGQFEQAVVDFLGPALDECVAGVRHGNLEIDLVCRLANQVGVIEIKSGKRAQSKEGLDQLNTAASRECLGTYTKKLLVIDRAWDKTSGGLRELAEAHSITIVELPSYSQYGNIDEAEKQTAIATVQRILGKRAA